MASILIDIPINIQFKIHKNYIIHGLYYNIHDIFCAKHFSAFFCMLMDTTMKL